MFSDDSTIVKVWRLMELLKRYMRRSVWETFGMTTVEEVDCFSERIFIEKEVWVLGKQGEWCMAGMNGRGL